MLVIWCMEPQCDLAVELEDLYNNIRQRFVFVRPQSYIVAAISHHYGVAVY